MAEDRPAKRQKAVHPIDAANSRTDEDFLIDYMRPSKNWQSWRHPKSDEEHIIRFASPGRLSEQDLEECYRLVEETSRKDYENSSVGWNEGAKREEMKSSELKYVLVEGTDEEAKNDGGKGEEGKRGKLRGFVSMMPTFENGEAVVYCYEIHIKPYLQGTGLAQLLMSHVTNTARNIPSVNKTMLTCFTSNIRGRRFYERLGFSVDERTSPRERKLRGGKVVKPDYVIMSKTESGDDVVVEVAAKPHGEVAAGEGSGD
ncbi:hypothetical protein CC79DRAFT_499459 [Sarocladium strictum]